jgi:hypothetical protein
MTFDERVQALRPFGFSPRQTAFLVTVALHGGYCLRRQYSAFAGVSRGHVVQDFFALLVNRNLLEPLRFQPNRGDIYHLNAKSLYRAIAQPDNRNRREVSSIQIARKLMVLDHVLATPGREWLATEHDKVAYFTTERAVALIDLPGRSYESSDSRHPATTRYFIHKLPIALDRSSTAPGPISATGADQVFAVTVTFVYLVRDETGAGFEQFLRDHLRLISRLSDWTISVVCPPQIPRGLEVCRRVFARTFAAPPDSSTGAAPDDLRWFFRVRQAVDRGDLRDLSVAELDRFRDARQRWSTAPIERLYAAWQRHGDEALGANTAQRPISERLVPTADLDRLTTHLLPFRYSQVGSMPGVA